MAKQKPWGELSPAYQKRLSSRLARDFPMQPPEVSRRNSEALDAARGHTRTNPRTDLGRQALALAAMRDPRRYGEAAENANLGPTVAKMMRQEPPALTENAMNDGTRRGAPPPVFYGAEGSAPPSFRLSTMGQHMGHSLGGSWRPNAHGTLTEIMRDYRMVGATVWFVWDGAEWLVWVSYESDETF